MFFDFFEDDEREGEFNNFNLSVALTEEFMQAVEKDEPYNLIMPNNKEITGTFGCGTNQKWSFYLRFMRNIRLICLLK